MKYPYNMLCESKYLPWMLVYKVFQIDPETDDINFHPELTESKERKIGKALIDAVYRLDQLDQQIIHLRYLEGYSDKEIRSKLNISQSTITEALHHLGYEINECIWPIVEDTHSKPDNIVDEQRLSKDTYYLNIADSVSKRSTCLRRQYGAIIVKNDEIVSTGYNGAPRGRRNCIECGCVRQEYDIPSGQRYELCRSVHAEANAIISASRNNMIGATLYLYGRDAHTGSELNDAQPCAMCRRLIINAGIDYVVSKKDGRIITTDVSSWIKDDDSLNLESLL